MNNTRDALDNFYKTLYTRTRKTGRANGNRPWSRPLASDTMAVHPDDIKEATQDATKKGVPTDFDKYGRPLFRDRNHRKRYCQAYGAFDKRGGYGDAQQGSTRARDKEPDVVDFSHLDEGTGPPGVERASSVRYFV